MGERLYLSTARMPDGRFLAVVSSGHPHKDRLTTVLTLADFPGDDAAAQAAAEQWFAKVRVARPWETRQ